MEIMENPCINWLVVRKTERTLRDSCFAQLKWAMRQLKVERYFKCSVSPLEITYIPTGQKILFRGLDDPLKVTSITVEVGALCRLWIEEAYEIMSEDAFNRLDESIRGQLPAGMYHQVVLTFNPWSDRHWLKKRFFDEPSENVLAMTTNYLCNEFLSESDLVLFEEMKKNPKRYQVAGLGNWGVVEGLVYENWKEQEFNVDAIRGQTGIKSAFGLDFGYTVDPTALVCMLVDMANKKIYIFDELYETGLTNQQLASRVIDMGYAKEKIRADSAEPKSIEELYQEGLKGITGARKGKDSILNGIQRIQDYELIVHPRCVNVLRELSTYQWAKDRFEKYTGKPEDENNHAMDAMRYGLEDINVERWSFD
nr:MAG TPA: terminase large subunit [Caudoviricetes sp.]